MSIYFLLKHVHVFLALASGIGFGLRGFVRLVLNRPLAHPMVRIGPHVVDTLLLLSGIALWLQMRFPLWSWFGLKLLMVAAYIGLGIAAFRQARRGPGVILYLIALGVFVGIATLAVSKPV